MIRSVKNHSNSRVYKTHISSTRPCILNDPKAISGDGRTPNPLVKSLVDAQKTGQHVLPAKEQSALIQGVLNAGNNAVKKQH
ncbi:MAG: hypothetical protein SFU25_02950 [Candidatus Caenarcaniphilales bacterium]|nr:hypothetical protein [Candidatus Caenarcaniphilales bacterium]